MAQLRRIFSSKLINLPTAFSFQIRNSSYFASKFLEDVQEPLPKYEVTNKPEDWKYVERILPPILIPEPTKKAEYRSGWVPQADNLQDRPYCIERTRNHMMPVYLRIYQRGIKRHTFIKRIQGDIWQFERDLRPFLKEVLGEKPVRLQVNEFAKIIRINGDHVNAIKYWLAQRGF